MLVIIVGDDQAMRLQLARALGPGRYELLCAVPTADVVPPVEPEEHVAALLAHRTTAALKADVERLRKRFAERVVCIAVATSEGRELESLVNDVDDFVDMTQGATFLLARLAFAHKRFAGARTARAARPTRSAVEDLMRAALGSGRDHLYVSGASPPVASTGRSRATRSPMAPCRRRAVPTTTACMPTIASRSRSRSSATSRAKVRSRSECARQPG